MIKKSKSALRVVINAISGLFIGAFVVLVAVILSLAVAFATSGSGGIPGLIDVWTTAENDATAINFNPNFVGMGIAVLVLAAIYTAVVSLLGHSRTLRAQMN